MKEGRRKRRKVVRKKHEEERKKRKIEAREVGRYVEIKKKRKKEGRMRNKKERKGEVENDEDSLTMEWKELEWDIDEKR